MTRRRAAIGAAFLLLGLLLMFVRSRARPAAAEQGPPDASVERLLATEMGSRRAAQSATTSAAQSSVTLPGPQATLDAGQAAVALKTLRSLFEVSAILHRNAIEAAENVDRYCAETAKLPKPLAPSPTVDPDDPATQEHDAAYFLLPRASWGTTPRTVGTLELPEPLTQRLRAAGEEWTTALSAADTARLDFSWMASLQQFNHWSLATVGPVAEQAATVDPFWAPIPYYLPLMDWAKLRMVQALATGDVSAALRDVQHLAELIASNGLTISEFAAARIVWTEQQFENAAAAAGIPLPSETPAFADKIAYQRFHDVALAGVAFMFPGVDPTVAKRALRCSPTPCAILSEEITLRREYERFTDSAEDDNSIEHTDQQACDRTLLRVLETSPSAGIEALAGYMGSELPLEKLFGPEVRARAER